MNPLLLYLSKTAVREADTAPLEGNASRAATIASPRKNRKV
jgi:hypothetical protein